MPINGYWIECVPVNGDINSNQKTDEAGLYNAHLTAMPDVNVVAASPDQAIDKLRQKLRALSRYYRMTGRELPERDNPVQPPRGGRMERGWISVYVKVGDDHANH